MLSQPLQPNASSESAKPGSTPRPRAGRSGFFLIETIFYVAMVGVLALACSRAFVAMVTMARDANQAAESRSLHRGIFRAIQRDVHAARGLSVSPDGLEFAIEIADQPTVTWQLDPENGLTRSDEFSSTTWRKFSPQTTFRMKSDDPATLEILLANRHDHALPPFQFTSQLMRLQEIRP